MSNEQACEAGSEMQRRAEAPVLPYLPREPRAPAPRIGLIGCGDITRTHLEVYRGAGYTVAALCDINEEVARARQRTYFPDAEVYTHYPDLLARDDIAVVDAATHPDVRETILADAIEAGKHVLSQKPFVLDLDVGEKLVGLAEARGVRLAVNQNGRWAPHFSYMRHAVDAGLIGDVIGVHAGVHWDHNWTAETPFNGIHHLLLYDFAIHWFDILGCLLPGQEPVSVYATNGFAPNQQARPPLMAQVMVQYPHAQASLVFDASMPVGALDSTFVAGTKGSLRSEGPDLNSQRVTLVTGAGIAEPDIQGSWFTNGFHGTMAELLCAIEEDRAPYHSAQNNLKSLALCFAAIASAESGQPEIPGEIRRMPEAR